MTTTALAATRPCLVHLGGDISVSKEVVIVSTDASKLIVDESGIVDWTVLLKEFRRRTARSGETTVGGDPSEVLILTRVALLREIA